MLTGPSSFFFRRLASPLHAARASVGATWALALMTATLVLFNPLVLLALTLAVLGAGAAAGVGRQLARGLRTAAIIGLPIVLVNVLVSRQGLTVFARLGDLGPFGQGDLTLEALVYGAVIALKVSLLILVTTLASLTVDPDALLRALRRLSFRSALTASLAMRMIPLLAADARRLAEAQRTRPGGAPTGAQARVGVLGAVVGGSLDRAMDVAATLELRGFAAARHSPSRDPRLSRRLSRRSRRPAVSRRPSGGRLRGAGPRAAHPWTSRSPARRRPSLPSPSSDASPARRRSRPTRRCTWPLARRRGLCAWRCAWRCCFRSATGVGSSHDGAGAPPRAR
jgi:energy-coupling factor transport system permease protein